MAEYIDRKSLIDEFDRLGLGEHSFVERVFSDGVRTIIAGIPAADVAPVVRGEWEAVDWREYDAKSCEVVCYPEEGIACTRCRNVFKKDALWKKNFCPNCGARMDGGACNQVCKYNTQDRGCVAGELRARCDLANVAGERGNEEAG